MSDLGRRPLDTSSLRAPAFMVLVRSMEARRDVLRAATLPLVALLGLWLVTAAALGVIVHLSGPPASATATTSGVVEDACPDSEDSPCHAVRWKDALERDHDTLVTFEHNGRPVGGMPLDLAYDPQDPNTVVVLDDRVQTPGSGAVGAFHLVSGAAVLGAAGVVGLRCRRRLQQEGPLVQVSAARWGRIVKVNEERAGHETC